MNDGLVDVSKHGRGFIDRTGQRFGRLTVLEYVGNRKWLCKCDCGNEKVIFAGSLTSGVTRSCGCLYRESRFKHNASNSRLYSIWSGMKQRCDNRNDSEYHNYGGRGIKVCDEWHDDFIAFQKWAMDNGYDPDAPRGKCTIDRIDNDGGYSPDNCRWVDLSVQNANRRHYPKPWARKAVERIDEEDNVIARYDSIGDAAKAVGCTHGGVSNVCNGDRKRIYGMRFRFAANDA